MSDTTLTSLKLLMEPWPVKCSWCGFEIGKAPLLAISMGRVPSLCSGCIIKMFDLADKPNDNKGMTITIPLINRGE